MEILFYLLFIGKLQSYISLKSNRQKCSLNSVFLKISRNSLENTCVGVSFIIMFGLLLLLLIGNIKKVKFLCIFLHFFHQIYFFSLFFHSLLIFPLKFLYCAYIAVSPYFFSTLTQYAFNTMGYSKKH